MTDESKAFESSVAELLRLTGYSVQPELLISYKKVDVYAEERRFGSRRRIAVECKHYAKPLTQDEVSAILANYRALYDANHVDEILLVTKSGITPSAGAMVRESRMMSHVTLAELEAHLLDFAPYLATLVSNVIEDDLESYYVPPAIAGGDLEAFIDKWLGTGGRPLAVLGGYGMGKTTFVRHYASVLARNAAADATRRVPIVLKLSEISSEQSLEGLLGRVLASSTIVRNYNFDVFMALNNRGRFVIFLDGFDEMKHTLSWDQFRFNFHELNRLVAGNSRIVLLGRPTAFLSDEEQNYALHGTRTIQGVAMKDPGWPDYQELRLQPFTPEQIELFVYGYSDYLNRKHAFPVPIDPEDTLLKIKNARGPVVADLASRPVQLRILTEVLPQWREDTDTLTTARLYDAFINIVIDREQQKIARRRFDKPERRAFARRLAIWLWTSARVRTGVRAYEIPDALFPKAGTDETAEGVRRDLITACFLEKKLGDALYFPHRSFQEFLVAEEVLTSVRRWGELEKLSLAVTPEVAEFIGGLASTDDCLHLDKMLLSHRGSLGANFLLAWLINADFRQAKLDELKKDSYSPWTPIMLTLAVGKREYRWTATSLANALTSALTDVSLSTPDRMVHLMCLAVLASSIERRQAGGGGDVLWHALKEMYRMIVTSTSNMSFVAERQFLRELRVNAAEGPAATLRARTAFTSLLRQCRRHVIVDEWSAEVDASEDAPNRQFASEFRIPIPWQNRGTPITAYDLLRNEDRNV